MICYYLQLTSTYTNLNIAPDFNWERPMLVFFLRSQLPLVRLDACRCEGNGRRRCHGQVPKQSRSSDSAALVTQAALSCLVIYFVSHTDPSNFSASLQYIQYSIVRRPFSDC